MGARPLRADLYRRFLAEVLELCECKVGAIVGDDAMGDPKPEGDRPEEVHGRGGILACEGHRLDPLCELVDRNEEISIDMTSTRGLL
jgi:hypothetical protein